MALWNSPQLADRYLPRCVLKAEVQHNLRDHRVDGAVEDPALDCKGKVGQGKVGVAAEEDVGHQAVVPSDPF